MAQPLALLFGDWTTFLDANGLPLASGTLNFFQAGTTTPQNVYADPNQVTSLGAIVTLNASGRPSSSGNPTGVYWLPTGYKVVIKDVNNAVVVTQDHFEPVSETILATQANLFTTGQKNATGGYTATAATDYLITANGTPINLPAAATFGHQLVIKNVSASPVLVTPTGTETIDNVNAAYSLPAASSPQFPSVLLYSDGISGWWIAASHKT